MPPTEAVQAPVGARGNGAWFRRLTEWTGRWQLPYWLVLLIVWAIVSVLVSATLWLDGTTPAGGFGRPALDAAWMPFGLFLMIYLSKAADRAFTRFLPALDGVDPTVKDGFRRRLTGLTNFQVAIGLVVGLVVGGVDYLGYLEAGNTQVTGSSVLSNVITGVVGTAGYSFTFVGVVLVIRILLAIHDVHRSATVVDLQRPHPLHAFAPVSSRAGILLLVAVTYSTLYDPATLESGVPLGTAITITSLAIVAFFLPLLGMRRRLADQKIALLNDSAARIEALERELETAVDERRLETVGPLKMALDVFQARRDRIARASTMPWDNSTLRSFATALLIPITTWLITTALNRTLF